jgi:hypothetical protein
VIEVLRARKVSTLDLTGGAPELNAHFRHLVRQARALGVRVIDRCNPLLSKIERGVGPSREVGCVSPNTTPYRITRGPT